MISSIEAGNLGNSSTEIICSTASQLFARSHAMASALKPPSDPSFAITICLNTSDLLICSPDLRQEPFRGDQRRHNRAAYHCSEQNRVLPLIDNVVGKPI